MSIQDRIAEVVERFNQHSDQEDRYKELIKMGKEMPKADESIHRDELLIRGCQSQVWLDAKLDGDRIYLTTDSDALITRGIVALLTYVYSGATIDEILSTKPDFLEEIGIREHLSMNRSNGLAAMLKQITIYAMAFKAKQSM